jgi:hypothetical protein
VKTGNPHTIKGKGFDAHPEHINRKGLARNRSEILNFSTFNPNYTKKEITPFVKRDYQYLDYIPFGSDNLFPQALALFSRLSPNHRGVLTSKERYFQGDGIIGSNPFSQAWIDSVNAEGETLNNVQKRLWIDAHRIGNEWIELISDNKGTFLFISQLDSTKCRLSQDEKAVMVHPDWINYTGKSDKLLKTFALYPDWSEDLENKSILRSVYHKFSYEPEFSYYGIPGHISGKDSVQIDFKTNKWNLARLINGFRLSGMLSVPVKDKPEADKVTKEVDKYVGEGNQDKVLLVTKSRAAEGQKAEDPTFTPFTSTDVGSWIDLHKQSLSDIVMAHGWFRSLCSIPDNTGFDTQRILNEYNIALPQIQEAQKERTDLYMKLYKEVTGKEIQIQFRNSPPLKTDKYFYVWEMREKEGLPVDKTDPQQMQIILDVKTSIKQTGNG